MNLTWSEKELSLSETVRGAEIKSPAPSPVVDSGLDLINKEN